MTGTYREALRLQAEAAAAVTAAGLDDVIVTLDSLETGPTLESGVNVVLITPPRLERQGHGAITEATWTVYAIAHDYTAPTGWWPALDALAAALTGTFEPEQSEFMIWRTADRVEYPAQKITFTT